MPVSSPAAPGLTSPGRPAVPPPASSEATPRQTAFAFAHDGASLSMSALSFAQAAAVPPILIPSPCSPPPRPPPSDLWRRCFRCLALDHKIDRCHDPVQCRRCWCFGHTERYCRSSSSRIAILSSSVSKISADSASHSIKMPATHSMARVDAP